jgi:O-antigen/teichoic acid export membrane protein
MAHAARRFAPPSQAAGRRDERRGHASGIVGAARGDGRSIRPGSPARRSGGSVASTTDQTEGVQSALDAETDIERPDAEAGRGANRDQIRGSSLLLVGRVIGLALDFIAQVLIVRYLEKTEYGAFALALSIVAIGTTVCLLGLERTVGRYAPIYQEKGDLGRMWGTIAVVIGTVVTAGLAVVLGVYVFQGLIGGVVENELALSILLLMIVLAPLQAIDSLLIAMFATFGSARSIFFRRYIVAPLLQLGIVIALIAAKGDVRMLALGYVAVAAIGIAVFSVVLLRMLKRLGLLDELRRETLRLPIREIYGFSLPLLATDLVVVLRTSATIVLIELLRTTEEVAEFRAVMPLAVQNLFVATAFRLIFTPGAARLFAREDHAALNDLYWRSAAWIAVLTFPLFALCVGFAEPFTVLLFGEQYRPASLVLSVLCIGYYVHGAMGFNSLVLRVFGRVRYMVMTDLLIAVVHVAAAVLLIRELGAVGAALATTGTFLLQNAAYQWGLRTRTWVAAFDIRYLRTYVSIAVGAIVIVIAERVLQPTFIGGVVLVGVVSFVVFAINRQSLRIMETYPELGRFRLMRRLFGDPSIT